MKTATYLRLSLLIPLIVWGLCILLFFLIAAVRPDANGLTAFGEAATIADYGFLFVSFYVFGIIIWILPYGLLALILFFWSFIGQAGALIKGFALSPLAMALLTTAIVILMDLGNPGVSGAFAGPGQIDKQFLDFNLLVTALALVWGYICVGLGFGIYELLQRLGAIRDHVAIEVVSTSNQPV